MNNQLANKSSKCNNYQDLKAANPDKQSKIQTTLAKSLASLNLLDPCKPNKLKKEFKQDQLQAKYPAEALTAINQV